jgi:hypothetical protein
LIREIIIISLLVFLVTQELSGMIDSKSCHRIAKFLAYPVACLLILFVTIIIRVVNEI